ncbi:MAG: hypothetical protein ABH843_04490, partial [Candidatus Omnitrophota bacterium]
MSEEVPQAPRAAEATKQSKVHDIILRLLRPDLVGARNKFALITYAPFSRVSYVLIYFIKVFDRINDAKTTDTID